MQKQWIIHLRVINKAQEYNYTYRMLFPFSKIKNYNSALFITYFYMIL